MPSSPPSAAADLSLYDPVLVVTTSDPGSSAEPLQGIVAHLGPVQFSSDADYVGIRLTGPSAGMGTNDGSVRGVRYFDCGGGGGSGSGSSGKGGVFVKRSAVTRRELSRLEALRLKRELRSAGGTGGGSGDGGSGTGGPGAGAARSPRPASSTSAASASARTSTSGKAALPSPSPSKGGTGGRSATSTSSRLDEIRAKRAALQASKNARTATPKKAAASGSSTPVKQRSSGASSSLARAAATTPPPSSAATATKRTRTTSTPTAPTTAAAPSADQTAEMSNLQAQLRDASARNAEWEAKFSAQQDEVARLRSEADEREGRMADATEQARGLRGEVERLTRDLDEADTREQQQGSGGSGDVDEARKEIRILEAQLEHSHAAIDSASTRTDSLERQVEAERKSKTELEGRIADLTDQTDELTDALDAEKRARADDAAAVEAELTEARAEVTQMRREVDRSTTVAANRGQSEQSHLRERARLEGEIGTLRRTVARLQQEKEEGEGALEELTLDKEALAEEKEALQDALEETRIDVETQQVELEEARMELEEARERVEELEVAAATGGGSAGEGTADATERSAEDDETSRTLAIQNSRLRDALIKLRDQSNAERLELSKELRTAQKVSERVESMTREVEEAKSAKTTLEGEVEELKEMVDQNSAFESMVEELSDRVLALEDDVVGLSQTVREMEEAAELAAEMEEVQAEELKATMLDLEGRDTVIRNLEEAIRMQRRREEDFQRTVSNYRSSIEKLQQEKTALLALQQGGEGERSTLIAKSQKALAKAATLVADAAKTRKREADAAFDRTDAQYGRHLSSRLESYLPHSTAVSSELSAVKGELLLAKVASKASMSLSGVASVLTSSIKVGVEAASEVQGSVEYGPLDISDETAQHIANALHETKFAHLAIETASQAMRILAAGQWPDLLSTGGSAELGAAVLRSMPPVDGAIGEQLRILKEEGALSSHRSNLVPLETSVSDAIALLSSTTDAESGELLIPSDWSPFGWSILQNASRARFDCLGSAAAVAAAIASAEDRSVASDDTCRKLSTLLVKLDQICTESSQACVVLTGLPVDGEVDTEVMTSLTGWKEAAASLMDSIKSLFSSPQEANEKIIKDAESKADDSLRCVVKLSSAIRSAKIVAEEGKKAHSLSPEVDDPWKGVASVVRKVRIINGDEEDINYILRAHAVESKLSEAIDSESKLEVAKNKVARLEKSLVSRSKEISLQNSRLSELEQMLAASGVDASAKSPTKKGKGSTSDEIRILKDENRMLTEAMDVLHGQVDEYEREIRSLKDPRAGKGRSGFKKTPKKGGSADFDLQSSLSKLGQAASADASASASSLPKMVALEAALFRPALKSARADASAWKAKAIASSIMNLAPLTVPKRSISGDVERFSEEISLANNEARLAKASFRVVDLTKSKAGKPSRLQLREELARTTDPVLRLDEAANSARQMLARLGASSDAFITMAPMIQTEADSSSKCLGRLRLPGPNSAVRQLSVHKNELELLHLLMLQ